MRRSIPGCPLPGTVTIDYMKEYIISDGTVSAVILPEKGATAVSLKKGDTEFLYRWDENLNSPERPRCGIPFLFPTFGRMQDETYRWEGGSYPMAIHGFAHTSCWTVEHHEENTLILSLKTDEVLRTMYPFDFRVRLAFTVRDGALTVIQDYTNLSDWILPYAFGFHPYFLLQNLEHAFVHAQADVRIDFASGKMLPFGQGTVTLTEPENVPEVGAALAGLQSPVVLDIPAEHRRLTMEFTPDFPQLVLWHPKNAPFLCVEPINGSPNGFNTGNHLILQPGEIRTVVLSFRPEVI